MSFGLTLGVYAHGTDGCVTNAVCIRSPRSVSGVKLEQWAISCATKRAASAVAVRGSIRWLSNNTHKGGHYWARNVSRDWMLFDRHGELSLLRESRQPRQEIERAGHSRAQTPQGEHGGRGHERPVCPSL
jgi:hypothetical protein